MMDHVITFGTSHAFQRRRPTHRARPPAASTQGVPLLLLLLLLLAPSAAAFSHQACTQSELTSGFTVGSAESSPRMIDDCTEAVLEGTSGTPIAYQGEAGLLFNVTSMGAKAREISGASAACEVRVSIRYAALTQGAQLGVVGTNVDNECTVVVNIEHSTFSDSLLLLADLQFESDDSRSARVGLYGVDTEVSTTTKLVSRTTDVWMLVEYVGRNSRLPYLLPDQDDLYTGFAMVGHNTFRGGNAGVVFSDSNFASRRSVTVPFTSGSRLIVGSAATGGFGGSFQFLDGATYLDSGCTYTNADNGPLDASVWAVGRVTLFKCSDCNVAPYNEYPAGKYISGAGSTCTIVNTKIDVRVQQASYDATAIGLLNIYAGSTLINNVSSNGYEGLLDSTVYVEQPGAAVPFLGSWNAACAAVYEEYTLDAVRVTADWGVRETTRCTFTAEASQVAGSGTYLTVAWFLGLDNMLHESGALEMVSYSTFVVSTPYYPTAIGVTGTTSAYAVSIGTSSGGAYTKELTMKTGAAIRFEHSSFTVDAVTGVTAFAGFRAPFSTWTITTVSGQPDPAMVFNNVSIVVAPTGDNLLNFNSGLSPTAPAFVSVRCVTKYSTPAYAVETDFFDTAPTTKFATGAKEVFITGSGDCGFPVNEVPQSDCTTELSALVCSTLGTGDTSSSGSASTSYWNVSESRCECECRRPENDPTGTTTASGAIATFDATTCSITSNPTRRKKLIDVIEGGGGGLPTATATLAGAVAATLARTGTVTMTATPSFSGSIPPTATRALTATPLGSGTASATVVSATATASSALTATSTVMTATPSLQFTPSHTVVSPTSTVAPTGTSTVVTMSDTLVATSSATRSGTQTMLNTPSLTVPPTHTWSFSSLPTASLTATRGATVTSTLHATPSVTLAPTASLSLQATPTWSLTQSHSIPGTPSLTATIAATKTDSASLLPTRTVSRTVLPTPSLTATRDATVTSTLPATPTVSLAATASLSLPATTTRSLTTSATTTRSLAPTVSVSLSATRSISIPGTPSLTASVAATSTASATRLPTVTALASSSHTRSAPATATASWSRAPTRSATPELTVTSSLQSTASVTFTAIATASRTVSATATLSLGPTPTSTFSASATSTWPPSKTVTVSMTNSRTRVATMSRTPTASTTVTASSPATVTRSLSRGTDTRVASASATVTVSDATTTRSKTPSNPTPTVSSPPTPSLQPTITSSPTTTRSHPTTSRSVTQRWSLSLAATSSFTLTRRRTVTPIPPTSTQSRPRSATRTVPTASTTATHGSTPSLGRTRTASQRPTRSVSRPATATATIPTPPPSTIPSENPPKVLSGPAEATAESTVAVTATTSMAASPGGVAQASRVVGLIGVANLCAIKDETERRNAALYQRLGFPRSFWPGFRIGPPRGAYHRGAIVINTAVSWGAFAVVVAIGTVVATVIKKPKSVREIIDAGHSEEVPSAFLMAIRTVRAPSSLAVIIAAGMPGSLVSAFTLLIAHDENESHTADVPLSLMALEMQVVAIVIAVYGTRRMTTAFADDYFSTDDRKGRVTAKPDQAQQDALRRYVAYLPSRVVKHKSKLPALSPTLEKVFNVALTGRQSWLPPAMNISGKSYALHIYTGRTIHEHFSATVAKYRGLIDDKLVARNEVITGGPQRTLAKLCPWFFVMELVTASMVSAAEGVAMAHCPTALTMTFLANFSMMVLGVVLRPLTVLSKNVAMIVVVTLTFVATVMAMAALRAEDEASLKARMAASAHVAIAAAVFTLVDVSISGARAIALKVLDAEEWLDGDRMRSAEGVRFDFDFEDFDIELAAVAPMASEDAAGARAPALPNLESSSGTGQETVPSSFAASAVDLQASPSRAAAPAPTGAAAAAAGAAASAGAAAGRASPSPGRGAAPAPSIVVQPSARRARTAAVDDFLRRPSQAPRAAAGVSRSNAPGDDDGDDGFFVEASRSENLFASLGPVPGSGAHSPVGASAAVLRRSDLDDLDDLGPPPAPPMQGGARSVAYRARPPPPPPPNPSSAQQDLFFEDDGDL